MSNINFHSLDYLVEKMRKIGIFKRLMVVFSAVILIPMLIIGFFSIQNLSNQNMIRATDSARNGLRNLDADISEQIKVFNDISYRLYLNEELKQLLQECEKINQKNTWTFSDEKQYAENKKKIGDILLSAQKQNPNILNIEIVNDQDEFVGSSSQEFPSAHISDLEQFRASEPYLQAKQSGSLPFWVNTVRQHNIFQLDRGNAYLGQHITHLRAINDQEGNTLGVIVINVSLDVFSALSHSSDVNVSEYHAVLLGDNDVVSYLGSNRNSNLLQLSQTEAKKLLAETQTPSSHVFHGQQYLVTTISCETTDWTLASILLKEEVQKDLYTLTVTLILIAATCLLLSFTMSYLVTISITRPVQRLCTAMKNIEINSDTAGYSDAAKDEVGLLGQDFNRMLKRNQDLIHRVYTMELEKKEETLLRKQAELDALQMQINPHFLYNTLDIIRWQIIDEEQQDSRASTMLVHFSDLLKLSTRRSQSLVPLSEEIDHIKAYLRVVEFDLDYTIDLQISLSENALICTLPKLTLQPLVENALIHAFSGCTEHAVLQIMAKETQHDLYIIIRNNGKKIKTENLEQINQKLQSREREEHHIGLMNVHDRIRLRFGEQYGLQLSQDKDGATEVIIHIPYTPQGEE